MNVTKAMRVSGTQGMLVEIGMYVSDCPQCGVIFGITTELETNRRKDGQKFFCPNGHSMSWSPDAEDKLRKEKAALEKQLAEQVASRERYQQWLRNERESHAATERRLSAAKGQQTKLKKRIAHGVCPCCNRTFAEVARHMKRQHPEYVFAADGTKE